MTVAEIIGRVRVALDHPLAQHPSDRQLRDIVLEEAQHYSNRVRLSQRRGEAAETTFILDPENPRTPIPISNLGTWVYGFICDTVRPWNEPPVYLVDAANFPYEETPRSPAIGGEPPCAVYGALLTMGGGTFFERRTPIAECWTVQLLYEEGEVTLTHAKSIAVPEHHDYLLTRCVIAAAPKAQWEMPDAARYGKDMTYSEWFDGKQRMRRKELVGPYMLKFADLQATFEKDIRRIEEPRVLRLSSGLESEELW